MIICCLVFVFSLIVNNCYYVYLEGAGEGIDWENVFFDL